jgi:hypothetical protein
LLIETRPMARRQEDRAWGLADALVSDFAAAIDNIAGLKSGFDGVFAHDDAPLQSPRPQQFPATPLRRARAFATITR